jgi:formate dehydrogenase gamma subunit
MNSQPIPAHPVALTAEQATDMEQKSMKKHDVAIVLLHWFNASTWLVMLISGLGLMVGAAYRLMPEWYTTMVASALGSRANVLRVHIVLGIAWIVVFVVYGVFGYRQYLQKEVLINEVGLDRNDFEWLRIKLLQILNRTQAKLPEQRSYNAGQKMFALLVYAALPVIAVTGIIMSFHLFGTSVVAWAMLLHFVAVGMVVSGLMVHFYMGAVFPEERPAFFSMITGRVNELFAYKHHFKWWREYKLEQQRWQQEFQSTTPNDPKNGS